VSHDANYRPHAARNFGILIVGEVVGQVVAFLVTAYLARTLGPDGFGTWIFAASVILYLIIVVDAGTESWGIREVSALPARLRSNVIVVIKLRLLLAFLVAALLLLMMSTGVMTSDRGWALAFGATSLFALALNTSWALRGIEVAAPVAAANLLQRSVMLGLIIVLVHSPAHAKYVTLWQGLSELAAAALCLAALVPRTRSRSDASAPLGIWHLLRHSWPIGISRAMRGGMFTANIAILSLFWPDSVVGEYGAAHRVAMTLLLISSIFGMAVFPTLSRACLGYGSDERIVISASFSLLGFLIAPICIGGAILAEPTLVLLFGQPFAGAAPLLGLLLATVLVMAISDNLRRVLQARRQQALDLRVVSLSALVSVPLIIGMVATMGAVGAAAASLISELFLMVLAAWSVRRTGPKIPFAAPLMAPALAAFALALAMFPFRHLSLATIVPIGALAYIGVLLLSRQRILVDLRGLQAIERVHNSSQRPSTETEHKTQ
jgi:O-antigen/teichoic acid export membrane protein